MAESSDELIRLVQRSSLPALLLRVPSEEIVAASQAAGRLLGERPEALIGRTAQEFSVDPLPTAFGLLAQGRVNGFQASRTLVRGDGSKQPLQVWVRAVERGIPVGCAVAVLWPGGRAPWMYLPVRGAETTKGHEIIGTVDAQLQIERVTDDVRALCVTPEDVIGASIFKLFDVTSAADVLQALAGATQSGRGLSLAVNVCHDSEPAMAELMLRPLAPAPSFSFCITMGPQRGASDLLNEQGDFERVGRGLHALALAETLARLSASGLQGVDQLTTRETDIICRLMDGDRVPAIARGLFLSQSTVRNHLSRAFHKLGVNSQQELIDLLREATKRLGSQDGSSP